MGNAYSSNSTAGFITDDITERELAFKIVPAAIGEPTGDVATGPSAGFTDIVTRVDGSGFYIFKDATNIYFRLRIGSIISGSKAYTVLIDTNQKWEEAALTPTLLDIIYMLNVDNCTIRV